MDGITVGIHIALFPHLMNDTDHIPALHLLMKVRLIP